MPTGWRMLTPHEIAGESRQALVIGPFGSNLKTVDYRSEGTPLVFVRDIRGGDFSNPRTFVSPEKAEELKAHHAMPGDVLITKMGDPPGDAAVYNGAGPAVITADCIRLRPALGFDARYIAYAMHSPDVRAQISAITSGVAHQKVSLDRFRHKVRLPVPPLPEQERIVEVLEDHLSRLDAGVDYLDAAERRLGSLRRALLDDAFFSAQRGEHDATASSLGSPEGWRTVALSEVAAIQGGIQKQAKRRPVLNKFPFLRVANVTSTGLDLTEVHEIELFEGEIDKYRLYKGDLLVVEGNGSPNQIGRAAVWDGSIPDVVHQNHLIRVRPRDEIDPRYLGLVWNSPKIREYLSRVSSSSSGLHTLSVRKLQQVMIPLAPFADQQRIITALEDRLSQLGLQSQHIAVAGRRAASLRRSLLAAAFSGQLTGSASDIEQVEESAASAAGDQPPAEVLF
ncbi:restriction endonuclease subunit S [Streptomyces sp. NPDC004129]